VANCAAALVALLDCQGRAMPAALVVALVGELVVVHKHRPVLAEHAVCVVQVPHVCCAHSMGFSRSNVPLPGVLPLWKQLGRGGAHQQTRNR